MAGRSSESNPYASPIADSRPAERKQQVAVNQRVLAPAILLTVVGGLGLLASTANCLLALLVDAQALPRLRGLGPTPPLDALTAVIQGMFVMLNSCILYGAVQMLRCKSWGWSIAASILAMVNVGSCCCLLGIPAGVWSLIVLANQDVKQALTAATVGDTPQEMVSAPAEPVEEPCPWCGESVLADEDGRCPACARPIE